jgi:putative SOS response-associated peptidase YedK
VILDPNDYEQWLDPEQQQAERLMPLLGPYPSNLMTAHPVNLRVNNPRNDDPLCLQPME